MQLEVMCAIFIAFIVNTIVCGKKVLYTKIYIYIYLNLKFEDLTIYIDL